jgi:hypothetical protein
VFWQKTEGTLDYFNAAKGHEQLTWPKTHFLAQKG